MKLQKTLFILVILFASLQICFGQEKPGAILIDEFGKITSEDFSARLDNLLIRLLSEIDSTAYIIIHNGKVSKNRERFRYEQLAKGQIVARRFDEKRIYIIRAADREEMQIQFWLVPKGAVKPSFTEVKWDTTFSQNAKPYIFTKTEWNDGLDYPPEYLGLNLFAEYLENNPRANGNFVIKTKSRKEFLKEQREIINILVGKYKIIRKRLNFFYIYENKRRWEYPQVEVWLVPRKIR